MKSKKIISNILITSAFICDKITTKGPIGIVVIVISSSDSDKLISALIFFFFLLTNMREVKTQT